MGGAWGRAAIGALIAGVTIGIAGLGHGERAGAAATPQVTLDDQACALLGPKHPGTGTDASWSRVVESRMRAAGLDTGVETFHMPVYTLHEVSMRITAPTQRSVSGTAFA